MWLEVLAVASAPVVSAPTTSAPITYAFAAYLTVASTPVMSTPITLTGVLALISKEDYLKGMILRVEVIGHGIHSLVVLAADAAPMHCLAFLALGRLIVSKPPLDCLVYLLMALTA
jgi:hypothetical protein